LEEEYITLWTYLVRMANFTSRRTVRPFTTQKLIFL
jgi:hypothetical protein